MKVLKRLSLLLVFILLFFLCYTYKCEAEYVGVKKQGKNLIYNSQVYIESGSEGEYFRINPEGGTKNIGKIKSGWYRHDIYFSSLDIDNNVMYFDFFTYIKEGFVFPNKISTEITKIILDNHKTKKELCLPLISAASCLEEILEKSNIFDISGEKVSLTIHFKEYNYLVLELMGYCNETGIYINIPNNEEIIYYKINSVYESFFRL